MKKFETKEAFIRYKRLDNWKTLLYDKRYLDAMDSILFVNGNSNIVAAVCHNDDNFYLSYNKQVTQADKEKLKKIWGFIETQDWEKLLIYHLIYNEIDF